MNIQSEVRRGQKKKNIAGRTVRNVNKKITRAGANLGKNSGLFDGIIRDSDSDDDTKDAVMLYNVGGEIHADSQLAYHHDTMEVDPSMIPRPNPIYDNWYRPGMPPMNAENQYYDNYYYRPPPPQHLYRPPMDYVMFEPDHEAQLRHVDSDVLARRYGNYYYGAPSPPREYGYPREHGYADIHGSPRDIYRREPDIRHEIPVKDGYKRESSISSREENRKSPPAMARPQSAMNVVRKSPEIESEDQFPAEERENAFKRSSSKDFLSRRGRSRSDSQEYIPAITKETPKDKKDKKKIFVDSPQGPSAFSLQGLRQKLKKKPKIQVEEPSRDAISQPVIRGKSPSIAEKPSDSTSIRSRQSSRLSLRPMSSLSTIRSVREDHEEPQPQSDWTIWGAVSGAYGIAADWTGYAWETLANTIDRKEPPKIEEEPIVEDQRPISRLSIRSLSKLSSRSPSRVSLDRQSDIQRQDMLSRQESRQEIRQLTSDQSPERQKNKLKEVMKFLIAQPTRNPSRSPSRTRTPSRPSSIAPSERSISTTRTFMTAGEPAIESEEANDTLVSHFVNGARTCARLSLVLVPIDAVADAFPSLQNLIVIVELFLLLWLLYQISIIIETVAMAVKAVCMPVIVISRFIGMNR